MRISIKLTCLLASLLMSCTPEWEEVPCRGEIKNGYYKDPKNMFQIALPHMGVGRMILDEDIGEGASHVFFSDDHGELYRVESVKITDELLLEICQFGMNEKEQLRSFYEAAVVAPLLEHDKHPHLLVSEILSHSPIGPVHYSVYFLPGCSHLVDTRTGQRESCFRAYAVKVMADRIVIFTYQPDLTTQSSFSKKPREEIADALSQKLFSFACSYIGLVTAAPAK